MPSSVPSFAPSKSAVSLFVFAWCLSACAGDARSEQESLLRPLGESCELVSKAYGPTGQTPLKVEKLVRGLTVPWAIAHISETDFLVTERGGNLRLVRAGRLVPEPVLRVPNVSRQSESGLLGLALHPDFARNRFFYIYYTAATTSGPVNRVDRYRLSEEALSAQFDRRIIDRIPASVHHDGGRIQFGPDGLLYIGTGDARQPPLSQNIQSLAGKLLRLTPDGEVPMSNPFPGSATFALGLRNLQAFDWIDSRTLIVADHGPSGELGRRGHDKVSLLTAGSNLGWPDTWRCQAQAGKVTPILVFANAMPPGGLKIYRGSLIPEWRGSALIATLGSEHLHRVVLDGTSVSRHEVYLRGDYGRLREVTQAPDGSLLVTTSNCDGRGECGTERDLILRITQSSR